MARGGKAGLDLGERGGDDLDVQDRHEHAEHHGEEGEQPARIDAILGRPARRSARCRGVRGDWQSQPWRGFAALTGSSVHGSYAARAALVGCGRPTGAPGLVSTLTTTDMPGRSTARRPPAGTRMRTGTRCTILVKLPVALSGGSSENTEPEAGATLSTVPSSLRSGKASTAIVTGWPRMQRRRAASP